MIIRSTLTAISIFAATTVLAAGVAYACSLAWAHHYTMNLGGSQPCNFSIQDSGSSDMRFAVDSLEQLILEHGEQIDGDCTDLDLTEKEDAVLQSVTASYSGERQVQPGSITIARMSDDQHVALLNQIDAINARRCNCDRATLLHRVDDISIHLIFDGNCGLSASCRRIQPKWCASRILYDITSFFGYLF